MKLNTLRPRRLRRTEAIRSMVRENSLELNDFVYPIFVVPGNNIKEEIPSMPGQYHLSVDNAVKVAEEIYKMGIPAVEVFGLPDLCISRKAGSDDELRDILGVVADTLFVDGLSSKSGTEVDAGDFGKYTLRAEMSSPFAKDSPEYNKNGIMRLAKN